jgi:selenocysteine lyase/cysteine desulfurase
MPLMDKGETMDVAAIRAEIPALDKTIYLNTGGYAPSPRRVTDASFAAYRHLQENGPDVLPVIGRVCEQVEETRRSLAALLGVTAEEIAFTRAVSEGINIVGWGLPFQSGDEVVITNQEHPSGRLPWYNLRERRGIIVREVELTADVSLLLDRIDAQITPRTRLLAFSHVTPETGLRLPAKEICDRAHARNVRVLFDAAQSVGQFPIDLHTIGADFYATTGHKWLLGGSGIGALYIRRELLGEVAVSWTGQGATESGQPDLAELPWWDSARHYEFGGRNWPAYVGYGVAVDLIREIGLAAIKAHVASLAAALRYELETIPGVEVLTPRIRLEAVAS